MRSPLWTRLLTFVIAGLLVATGPTTPPRLAEAATQVHGSTRWAVLLCKFSDDNTEPHAQQFYRDFFSETGAGQGGLYDYWKTVSYGNIDLSGSSVFGWYTLPYTAAELNNLGGPQPGGRAQKIQACVDTAMNDPAFPAWTIFSSYYGIAVMWNNPGQTWGGQQTIAMHGWGFNGSLYGWGWRTMGAVALNADAWQLAPAAHEVGHGYGLPHSFAEPNAEYGDRWDIMSWARVFWYNTSPWGASGPSLSAAYRSQLGWIPANRTYTYPGGAVSQSLRLTPVNQPNGTDYMMAQVPIDATTMWIVEQRQKSGYDRGIPRTVVQVRILHTDTGRSFLETSDQGSQEFLVNSSFTNTTLGLQMQVADLQESSALIRIGPPIGFGPPAVSLTPTTLSLDTLAHVQGQVVLKNSGGSPLHMTSVTVGGASPAEFGIVSNSCTGMIVQADLCKVIVAFYPGAGTHRATLYFADDATPGPQAVTLTGTILADPTCRNGICQ
jgi:M6 family metalloprotease-like protein